MRDENCQVQMGSYDSLTVETPTRSDTRCSFFLSPIITIAQPNNLLHARRLGLE